MGQIFTVESAAAKQSYFDDLRACKFILCPRGNSVCSVRLFEALEAGRVPVILSNPYVLPAGLDCDSCLVAVPERDLDRVPELLAAREPEWPTPAANARAVSERNFSDRALLGRIATELRTLRARRGTRERWTPLLFPLRVLPQLLSTRLKQLRVRLEKGTT